MNKKWTIIKALIYLFTTIFCVVLIYMVVDFGGDSKDILSSYNVVDGSKSEFPKQLQFMKEYIRVTGDITIALNTGMTPEEIEQIMDEEDPEWDEDNDDDDSGGPTGGQDDPDLSNKDSADWTEYEHNGSKYIWEKQNAKWANVTSSGGSTMKGAGCMWFALSCAKSNVSGSAYGVEDALDACGYSVSKDGSGNWSISPQLPCVGNDSGKTLADGTTSTVPNIGSKIGLSVGNDTITIPSDADFSSYIYIVHANSDGNRLVSSGGQHWFVVVGTDGNGNYCLANVATSNKVISKSNMSSVGLNHCYAVRR